MRVYRKDRVWYVVKDGLVLGCGPSLEAIKPVLQENWA